MPKMAREYFTEPNRDFVMVCNFAGFDYEYIRMKATKYFNSRKKEQYEKEKKYVQDALGMVS